MYVTILIALLVVGGTFSALQLFAHRGGVAGTMAALVIWAVVYFAALDVQVRSGTTSGLVTVQQPLLQWAAVGLIVFHTLVLLFVLAGIGPWSETSEGDGLADAATQMGDRL